MTDELRERVAKLEERSEIFEVHCKEYREMLKDAIEGLAARIDKFLNHEVHKLEEQIEEAKNSKREPLSKLDWSKIVIAIITVTGTIIVALIRAGLI